MLFAGKKAISTLMLTLLLTSMLTLAFNIQPVKATGTIYIRADGSIDPPTAPIATVDDVTYVLTNDIFDPVVVERNNTVVDGASYTLTGSGSGNGTTLAGSSNVTVRNMTIKNFTCGIYLGSSPSPRDSSNNTLSGNDVTGNNGYGILICGSSNNTLSGNDVTGNNGYGILICGSSNNTLSGNNVTENDGYGICLYFSWDNVLYGNNVTENDGYGICLYFSFNNVCYHNNCINNTQHAYSTPAGHDNSWDDGYPSGGNYWSDYADVDLYSGPYQSETGSDGIWDHPYAIEVYEQDRYPLVDPWTPVSAYVQGIDVSQYQGDITWSEVYGAGYRFAYAKTSEGNGLQDPNFAGNMVEGRGAGLFMGAYHLGRPDLGNSAHDEAHFFVDTAYGYLTSGYLRPVLRVSTGSSMGKEALSNWIIEWVEEVRSLTNAEPLIQVTSEYANYYLDASLAQYDLWISHWTYDPSTSPNTGEIWDTWSFWQYSNLGSVPGIDGNVFLDLFNGTNDDLQKMLLFLPPEADFTYSPKKPLIKETITFDASSSYDPNGRILLCAWSTTDGQTYISEEPTWETRFTRAGEYTVTLEVVDNDNQRDTKSFRVRVTEDWTFAVITDIHMGYNFTDYGTLGWNDAASDGNYRLTERLSTIVDWINSHEESNNIHFVAILGDISDSGEKSELLKARDILNGLNIPYIPVIGNHDIWPYTQQVSTTDIHKPEYYWQDRRTTKGLYPTVQLPPGSAETAIGDEFFDEVFWQQNGVNRKKIEALFGNSWKRQIEQTGYTGLQHIQNCVFVYKNVKFIVLDFIDRNPTEDTQSSNGKLYSDTEQWLTTNLMINEPTVLFSHHAIVPALGGSISLPGSGGTDGNERIYDIIKESECNLLANFAGHNHANAQEPVLHGGINCRAVTTEAVCRESISWLPDVFGEGFVTREKKNIRLVNMTWDKQMKSYRTQVYIYDEDIIVPKWWNNLFRVNCPVDLTITDPDGFTITKEIGAVAGMFYLERDWDGDGDLDDLVILDSLKPGNYQISVTPEPGALPNDTYTLQVFGSDAATVLAENVSISDIPTEPYIVNSTVFTLNIPPTTSIEIGEPKIVNGTTYVSPATPIDLTASDNPYGSGLASTAYRIYNATFDTGWTNHTSTICLTGLSEDTYQIDYYSIDCAGNVEPTNTATVILKNPNIALTNITLFKTVLGQGFNLHVNVTIQNQGMFSEDFDITFYANTTIIGTVTDVVSASGNATTIPFSWNTTGFAKGNYTLSAYAWPVQDETDTLDNTLTDGLVCVGIPGDVDGNHKVDIKDILIMAKAYGTNPQSPNWNPNADVDCNDKVDIKDILIAAKNFGKTDP
jgi:parallel beta-helix repeat protein